MLYILGGIIVSAILLLVGKNRRADDPTTMVAIEHGHIIWDNVSTPLKTPNLRAVINDTTVEPAIPKVQIVPTVEPAIPTVEPAIPTDVPAIPKIDIDLAVLVLTGRDYKDRRKAIRSTWGSGHSNVYFVIGKHCPYRPNQRKPYVCEPKSPDMKIDPKYNSEQERLTVELSKEPDVVMVDMIDVYRHLATKLHLGYRWTIENTSAKYVLKIDDDSFARVDSISHWLLSRLTAPKYEMLAGKFGIGVGVTRWGKWAEKKYKPNKYPPWPSGAGHIVSRPVIEYLHHKQDTWVSYQGEDTSMGIWMDKVKADMKVTLTTSEHFITHSGDCHDKSKFVIGHAISIAKLIRCFGTMDEWDHVSAKTPSGCLRGIEMDPFELIRNHWDIIVKAVYAAAYLSPVPMPQKVSDTYSKLNLAWGGGREKCDKGHNPTSSTHPNCVPKRSIADFIRTFHATIDSMNKNGFDSSKGLVPIIPVSGTYFAINGAHRIGAAIATNNNVCVEKVNLSEHNWNENFFRRKGVPNSDLIMRDWFALDKKMIVVVLNPKTVASSKMSKVRKIVSECARTKSIVYEKDYAVNSERMRSILSVAYGQESWFKNLALERYADGFLAGPTSSCKFLFIHGDQEKMKECKLRIRKLLNFAGTEFKKSCHIGDNYEQHLSMANHILDRKHGGILTEHVAKTVIGDFETVIGDETVRGVIDWNGGAGAGIHKTIHLNKQGVRSLVSHLGLNEPVARQLSVTVSFESNLLTTDHLNRQQTIILAQMTLNDNSVMFLNKHVSESCLEVATELSTRYKLKPFVGTSWQFPSDLMIESGAVMSFFGLRKRTDIDVISAGGVDKSVLGWQNEILVEEHKMRVHGPIHGRTNLLTNQSYFGYCHGLKFVGLEQLRRYKLKRGKVNWRSRDKDYGDAKKIESFLQKPARAPANMFGARECSYHGGMYNGKCSCTGGWSGDQCQTRSGYAWFDENGKKYDKYAKIACTKRLSASIHYADRWIRATARIIMERYPVTDQTMVYDACMGCGGYQRALREHANIKVYGCDVSTKMAVFARDKITDGTFIGGACTYPPSPFLPDETFGVVIVGACFNNIVREHIINKSLSQKKRNELICQSFNELWRVLKPGGLMAIPFVYERDSRMSFMMDVHIFKQCVPELPFFSETETVTDLSSGYVDYHFEKDLYANENYNCRYQNGLLKTVFIRKPDTNKLPSCNWPAPLYPQTKKRQIDSLSIVQKWLVAHRSTAVAYLQSGVLLGLYRDGTAMLKDNDIDIRFGVMGNNAKIRKQLLALKRQDSELSFNDMSAWGDFSNYISKNNVDDQLLTELSERLCLAARSPIQTLNNARQDLENEYGPFWFVKVPFRGMHVQKWKSWTNSVEWRKMMSIISKMDVNSDSTISTDELDAYVLMDGIDEKEYKNQISSVDKCRAAAGLSWLINYDMAPYHISIPSGQVGWPDFPEFKFPECGV